MRHISSAVRFTLTSALAWAILSPAQAQPGAIFSALRGAAGETQRLEKVYEGQTERPALTLASGVWIEVGTPSRAIDLPRYVPPPPPTIPASAPPKARREKALPLVVPAPKPTPEYKRTFRILAAKPEVTDRYDELILKHSRWFGLDARLIKSIMAAESEFRPEAVSPRGARGLMQVMPATGQSMGVPQTLLAEADSNIFAGVSYLEYLFRVAWKKFGLGPRRFTEAPLWLVQRVIAAYNAGPRFLQARGERGWYRQTRDYVRKVLLYYNSGVTDIRRPAATQPELPEMSMTPVRGLLF